MKNPDKWSGFFYLSLTCISCEVADKQAVCKFSLVFF
jgi:hypothetical protein